MPKYHVARSTVIEASPEEVFDAVSDFSTWTSWSPWLCADPKAKIDVSQDPSSVGSEYKWNGDLVGQGEIEHVLLDRGRRMEEELRMLKPWTSTSKVVFEFQPSGGGTELTWNMYGSLPWFMFWMKSMMETFIGMDYERGLRMLKEKIETGEVLSSTEIVGVVSAGPLRLIGSRKACAMADLGPSMGDAFGKVAKAFETAGAAMEGECLSAYHKWDMKAKTCEFTSGFAVDPEVNVTGGVETVEIPSTQAIQIRHTGSYPHLGNAWSAGHQYLRYKKLKLAKLPAFEIYRNDPDTTPAGELVTDIYLPIR